MTEINGFPRCVAILPFTFYNNWSNRQSRCKYTSPEHEQIVSVRRCTFGEHAHIRQTETASFTVTILMEIMSQFHSIHEALCRRFVSEDGH